MPALLPPFQGLRQIDGVALDDSELEFGEVDLFQNRGTRLVVVHPSGTSRHELADFFDELIDLADAVQQR